MVKQLEVELKEGQREALEELRDMGEKAYLRERAAAILKIADGKSAHQVSQRGLLRRRAPDTVYKWVHRFLEEGLAGLKIREGRGRKPSFSPSVQE